MSSPSLSHQVLNKIDEIKEKLSDNEYKEIVELLQEKHKQDGADKTKYTYKLTIYAPYIFSPMPLSDYKKLDEGDNEIPLNFTIKKIVINELLTVKEAQMIDIGTWTHISENYLTQDIKTKLPNTYVYFELYENKLNSVLGFNERYYTNNLNFIITRIDKLN